MDDVISRQQAIVTAVSAAIDWHKLANPQYSIAYCIGAAMRQLPPAEPKRETTTLRIGRTRNSVTMWYECAECGEPVDQEDAFCRRCGRGIIHE